ncbi:hypothetical protein [Marivirga sp.]|uniref:hypothetical protein n=1 Tax=Marivirga sp. TaxID=2018662 RepID=UPI002D7E55BC|nr:hypothetical protein [Marivirga sp.]HET8861352.1 hypothetical protein [Marivirga sp.]
MKTFKKKYKVKDNQLIIDLPRTFEDISSVIVTIEEDMNDHQKKINMMRKASKDPLFMSDIKEVNDDFRFADSDAL